MQLLLAKPKVLVSNSVSISSKAEAVLSLTTVNADCMKMEMSRLHNFVLTSYQIFLTDLWRKNVFWVPNMLVQLYNLQSDLETDIYRHIKTDACVHTHTHTHKHPLHTKQDFHKTQTIVYGVNVE